MWLAYIEGCLSEKYKKNLVETGSLLFARVATSLGLDSGRTHSTCRALTVTINSELLPLQNEPHAYDVLRTGRSASSRAITTNNITNASVETYKK